jgi:hypothetical protein
MTRDEARALPLGSTVRWFEDRRSRFGRLAGTDGYKNAVVEIGGGEFATRSKKIRYEEIDEFRVDTSAPAAPAKRGR